MEVSDPVACDHSTTCRIDVLVGHGGGLSFWDCSTGLFADRLERARNDKELRIQGIGKSLCLRGNNAHHCTLWLWFLR